MPWFLPAIATCEGSAYDLFGSEAMDSKITRSGYMLILTNSESCFVLLEFLFIILMVTNRF